MKCLTLRNSILAVIALISLMPLALYFFIFHGVLSKDAQAWSTFGTYIGGVYGPIATLISVIVLIITLKEMQASNTRMFEYQNKQQVIDNLRWLSELLRKTLDNNSEYVHGRREFYDHLKTFMKKALVKYHQPDNISLKSEAIKLMKNNKTLFANEIVIFEELFYRVTHITNEEEYVLSVMVILGLLSSEERFWLMQYAKAHSSSAAKWLKKWPGFDDIPLTMESLIQPK
ncbi:putative membrane protein [Lelliottia sp. 489]|uniref:hypothetical protein n=1 Tax=Lelliottia sp. 489 TaxID=3156448 RepID=UPI003D1A55D9